MPKPSVPDWSAGKWIGWFIALAINVVASCLQIYFWHKLVIGDGTKQIQGVCVAPDDMSKKICVLAVGQFSQGIFCIGQVNIGLFCFGQINIGVFFAMGQVALSVLYAPVGQIAFGSYTHFAQLGLSYGRVQKAQVGINLFYPFFGGDMVSSCTDSASNRNKCCLRRGIDIG